VPFRVVFASTKKGARVTARNLSGFVGACQEAVIAVLDAIATVGEERQGHLKDAKLAVDRALHDARSGEEWYLADHLRRGIKDVEAHERHVA
jgi:hypothetical protein